MAITGTGTQADPYLVHNYWELKSTLESQTGQNKYIKLENDINCNNYGYDFTWQTINVNGGDDSHNYSTIVDVDLGEHKIENVLIAEGSYMFKFPGLDPRYSSIHASQKVRNGKILNVFSNNARSISHRGIFESISFSADLTSLTNTAFEDTTIKNSSFFIQGTNYSGVVFYPPAISQAILNTRIELDLKNQHNVIFETSSTVTAVNGCRIEGNVIFDNYSSLKKIARYPKFADCVFNVYSPNIQADGIFSQDGCTGVVNKDLLPANTYLCGLTGCTDAEIKNGETLRSKGFIVFNTEA